jgi:hypothetical protein
MILQGKRFIGIMLTVTFLLLIILVAGLFTNAVNWSLFDFVLAGTLLFGTGIIIELMLQKIKKNEYRIALIFTILLILSIVWLELAVGIFGSRFAGQ